jgi:hypothetical protein
MMKTDYWTRLAAVARRAPARVETPMPFGFDTRAIAGWKVRSPAADGLPWIPFLRGALVCSTVIMLLSLVLSQQTTQESEGTAVAIADSALRISFSP